MAKPTWDDTEEIAPTWEDTAPVTNNAPATAQPGVRPQDFLSKTYHVALPVGGALGGGTVGSGIPGGGTFIGGSLGFGGGIAMANAIDRMRGMKAPLKTSEIVPETASNLLEGVQGEMLGGIGGKVIPAIAAKAGKGISKFQQFMTGKPAQEFERLAKDPGALLPSKLGGPKSMEEASGAYGQFPKKIDVADDSVDLMTGAYRKATDGATDFDLTNPDFIKQAVKKLEPGEAYKAYQATQQVIKGMVENKNPILYRNRILFKNALKDYLVELEPTFGKATKDFARSALRKSLTDILPSNKYGTPSIGRAGFLAPVLGPLGYAMGGIPGAIALPAMAGSPLVNAVGRAGGAVLRRALSTPEASKAIYAGVMDRKKRKEAK